MNPPPPLINTGALLAEIAKMIEKAAAPPKPEIKQEGRFTAIQAAAVADNAMVDIEANARAKSEALVEQAMPYVYQTLKYYASIGFFTTTIWKSVVNNDAKAVQGIVDILRKDGFVACPTTDRDYEFIRVQWSD